MQTLVSNKLIQAYDRSIAKVEASHGEASRSLGEYWWALYVIRRDNLWRAKFDEGHFTEWLQDLEKEPFGPKHSDYYSVMWTVEKFLEMGLTEDEVQARIGHLTTAMKVDLKLLFANKGKGDLLPEIQAQLESEHETFPEFIDRIAQLGPGEQRTQVSRLTSRDHIFPTDADYDEKLGRLLVNLRWESDDDGIVWTGTVTMTAFETTSGKRHKKNFLPAKISDWLKSNLHVRENG